ncbi:hypothetical protein [Streptomyces prunicolor]|uniref:hypothetical protein n=1 Tax=Streptomyces prunicolor TaxID=67348 RepID=UPI0003784BE3|nr:hypothetical protein [Streptomyces prunicolor]
MFDLLSRLTGPGASGRTGSIAGIALNLLFDVAQQAVCVGAGTQSWASLAVYDADEFASFATGESE